ncbi:MAG: hypothetical protein RRB24_06815 [Armatimonadota bacterium]|nr:hypothetical protein [Armatimonadota bacterium]MDT7972525.1 hypothetical protein [Armatimonadota bacterium]
MAKILLCLVALLEWLSATTENGSEWRIANGCWSGYQPRRETAIGDWRLATGEQRRMLNASHFFGAPTKARLLATTKVAHSLSANCCRSVRCRSTRH